MSGVQGQGPRGIDCRAPEVPLRTSRGPGRTAPRALTSRFSIARLLPKGREGVKPGRRAPGGRHFFRNAHAERVGRVAAQLDGSWRT